jgi:hypothetical protein
MNDFCQRYLPKCEAVSAVFYDYSHQLAIAIGDRFTLANLTKAGFLLILLWITLRIIGRVNGIEGNDTWPVQVNQVNMNPRFVRLSRGAVRKNGEPISEAMKAYDERSGIVEFRIPVTYRPLLNKLGLGPKQRIRQTRILTKNCVLEVPPNSSTVQKVVSVDPATAARLATSVYGRDLDSDDEARQAATILTGAQFTVTVKRANSISFLLSHPDPTLKTTAWVLLVGTLFEITRSIIFETAPPVVGTVVGTVVGN